MLIENPVKDRACVLTLRSGLYERLGDVRCPIGILLFLFLLEIAFLEGFFQQILLAQYLAHIFEQLLNLFQSLRPLNEQLMNGLLYVGKSFAFLSLLGHLEAFLEGFVRGLGPQADL